MDKNQQLTELNKRISAKFKSRTLLFGKGNFGSQIMLVSEYPNEEEIKKEKHLAGNHGKIVDLLLKNLNLTRRNLYITHAVKASQDNNELPHPKEIKQFSQFLREEIKILEPKLIIALGGVALRGLNVKLPLFNIRGKLIRFGTNSLFATHHPSTTTKDPLLQMEMEKDFKQLVEVIKNLA
ncbi:MAG: uracil-DNA glycosylase [Candidatus Yanofskybacteria bacterium]|nr:uracil-DNA glycosylase [Candidatus Yanofskybacteria bacterium]